MSVMHLIIKRPAVAAHGGYIEHAACRSISVRVPRMTDNRDAVTCKMCQRVMRIEAAWAKRKKP